MVVGRIMHAFKRNSEKPDVDVGKRRVGCGEKSFFSLQRKTQVRTATARICFVRTVDPAPRTSGHSC
jgi:hypothetical protein